MYQFDLGDENIATIGAMLWPDLFEGMTDSSNTLVPKVVHEDSTTGNHSTTNTDLLNFKETVFTPASTLPMGVFTAQSNYSYPVSPSTV